MIKDSQVDLCGQIGYEGDETFPVLTRGERFEFACNGCGDCCRGRGDIVLSGYDLYRICARLRLPPKTVVHAFCRQYVGKNSRMPVVRLAPLREARGNCPFLHQNHCAIHDAEPLVCALYPLGQQIELDGTVNYFMQTIDCGGTIISARVEDFLARYDIAAREPLDVAWAMTCIRLSKTVRRMEQRLLPVLAKRLQDKLLSALYFDYDFEKPYEPQFKNNVSALEKQFEKLEQLQIRAQGKE